MGAGTETKKPAHLKPAHLKSAHLSYVWGLDLVRFAAAAIVAVFHFSWRIAEPDVSMAAGWVGVQIFFTISGFVISQSANDRTPMDFLRGRFARLYPAAWCCVFIAVLALSTSDAAVRQMHVEVSPRFGDVLNSLLLLRGPFVASALWTLPIEIAFYGFIFLVLFARKFQYIEKIAIFLTLWSAPYIAAYTAQTLGFTGGASLDIGYGNLNKTLIRHGCFFALGIMLWLHTVDGLSRLGRIALWLAFALCLGEILCRAGGLHNYAQAQNVIVLAAKAAGIFTVAVVVMILSIRFNHMFPESPIIRKITRTLGLVTYPFYLMHEAWGGTIAGVMVAHGVAHGAAVLVGMAATFAVSIIVVNSIEPGARRQLMRAFDAAVSRGVKPRPFLAGLFRPGGRAPPPLIKSEPAKTGP